MGLNIFVLLPDDEGADTLRSAPQDLRTEAAMSPPSLVDADPPAPPQRNGLEALPRESPPPPSLSVGDPSPGSEYGALAVKIKAYVEAGDTVRFMSALKELRDRFPENAAANRELGRAYVQKGENTIGLYYLEQALAVEPGDPATLQALSLAYYRTEDLERARQTIRQFLAVVPDDRSMKDFLERVEREHRIQSSFITERSDHFDLFYDSSEFRQLGRPILRLLEEAYRKVGADLGVYPDQPVSVLLYSNRSFREVTASPDWTGGIFDGKIRLPVRDMDPDDPRLTALITHEFVHAVVHGVAVRCPTWLNEGLAMYFEGRSLPSIRVRADLRQFEGSFMSLNPDQARAAYLLSLSAVSYLIREFGMYRVREILLHINQAPSFQEAFDHEMPLGYDDFIRRWHNA